MRFIFTLSFRLISKGRYRNSDVARVLLLAWSNEQSLKKLLTKKRTNNNRSQPTHTCMQTFTHMVRYINRQKREREKNKCSSLYSFINLIYIYFVSGIIHLPSSLNYLPTFLTLIIHLSTRK